MFRPVEKKFRLFRAWAGRNPIWCGWQVTYRCNYRCRFCHYWHDPLGEAQEPTVADYAFGARKLASVGTMMISLAGGEPLLRLDIPEIVAEVGRYHLERSRQAPRLMSIAMDRSRRGCCRCDGGGRTCCPIGRILADSTNSSTAACPAAAPERPSSTSTRPVTWPFAWSARPVLWQICFATVSGRSSAACGPRLVAMPVEAAGITAAVKSKASIVR